MQHPINEAIRVRTNWSFNRFTFGEYELDGENLDGNLLPGLPDFQGYIQLDVKLFQHLAINYQNQLIGKIFTNDGNTVSQDPVSVSNISLKYNLEQDKFSLHPYIGVNNLFQATYADNIRINAFGGRFFEAAPNQLVFGGVRIRL